MKLVSKKIAAWIIVIICAMFFVVMCDMLGTGTVVAVMLVSGLFFSLLSLAMLLLIL